MSDENKSEEKAVQAPAKGSTGDERIPALFATMVVQQANMALMFLGKVPHPETGEKMVDLETARLFIDQLEMLEIKTRGNLTPQEAALLKQQLMNVRLAFVDAANQASASSKAAPATPSSTTAAPTPSTPEGGTEPAPAESESGSRKKFTKKY